MARAEIRPIPVPLGEAADAPMPPEPDGVAVSDVAPGEVPDTCTLGESETTARAELPAELAPIVEPAVEAPAQPQSHNEPQAAVEAAESRGELPWAHVPAITTEMVAVVQRADARVRHGFQLAERGALYSARAEFIAGLQIIAQANDAQQNTQLYSKSLTAGIVALKESSEFVRQNAGKPEIEVKRLVAAHKTPVLKNVTAERISPTLAAKRYYDFAQEQLAAAAAQEPTGSMALYGLAQSRCPLWGATNRNRWSALRRQ